MQQWTDAVALTLATAAPIPKVVADDWIHWALVVISIPSIAAFTPPNPVGFSDWETWAQRFVECVLL